MSRPWMPMYWGDYLKDTMDLSFAQHGAYLLLIAHYWQNGGLPTDDISLCKIVHANRRQWRYLRPAVVSKFGPNWTHKRIDAEILRSEKRIMQRVLAGEKSVAARRKSTNGRSSNRSELKSATVQRPLPATVNQPHKKNITTTTSVAARETAAVENKRPPRKEVKEEPREIGPAEYMARVGNK